MSLRGAIAGRASLVGTVIVGALVLALVVTLAVVSGGYPERRMHLGSPAVWVTNDARQLLGRANTAVRRLNTVVSGPGSGLDVLQRGKTVVLVDTAGDTAATVDPATAEASDPVPLPARRPGVALAGGRVVVSSGGEGRTWLVAPADLGSFTTKAQPTLDLGARTLTAAEPGGTVFAYAPEGGALYRLDAASGASSRLDAVPVRHGDSAALTASGEHWALFEPRSDELRLPSGRTSLAGTPAAGGDTVLQRPSDDGDAVYLASPRGLVEVSADGGEPRTLVSGTLGAPAAPVVVGGCVYAAWAGGTTFSRCGDAHPRRGTLESVSGSASLAFRVNGERVVLNDAKNGTVWAVQDGNARIDNWAELAPPEKHTTDEERADESTPPERVEAEEPPVAVDDRLGARPGRANPVPVLLNDHDPNGDALVIDSFTKPAVGELALVGDHRSLQLTLPADATGSVGFDYTISDGRGGTASAHVSVAVRTPGENSPPVQVQPARVAVRVGGRVERNVLGGWYDPDGDPFYLAEATTRAPDTADSTPAGRVVFTEAEGTTGTREVALTVSDGRASGTGTGTLTVSVKAAGHVPISVDPFVVTATAGTAVTVSPLTHARGGDGTLRLGSVHELEGASIEPDYDAGTFRFRADSPGTRLVRFSVTDGRATTAAVARIEVEAPPDTGGAPVTVPHTVFVRAHGTRETDVLGGDFDPAGGVLLVTGVSGIPEESGVRVEVREKHYLRVTLTRPLDAPTAFHYTVSNGLASSTGTVTVVQIPAPTVHRPPLAEPDTVTVRVGDAVDIPVLDNDTQPDGEELTLDPTLASPLPKGAGLLFASGDRLRYLAPDRPGDYTAAYRVDSPDGQWASAQVTINVREKDSGENRAPAPKPVTARVLAGETVRIPIPLNGVDPDGDSVTLLGQLTSPEKGTVTKVGPSWIEYRAGDYSTGTDTFDYGLVDALGARASGTVRVGIAPRAGTVGAPVAAPDEVTVRPGRTVTVRVLENDSDPAGGALTVTGVRSAGNDVRARVTHDLVRVRAPGTEGRYGFVYTIRDERGGTASNFLSVVVSRDAPPARPVAADAVLSLTDILDRRTVDVDVLANAFFAEGSVDSLTPKLVPGYTHGARVLADKRIRVPVGRHSRIIPYALANPHDPSAVAYAFIRVPGSDDAAPQLRPGQPALRVRSEQRLTIDLERRVVAVGDRKVRLTSASTVHATHSDGGSLVVDDHTLQFTSAPHYFGPASVSFRVTDGDTSAGPDGRTSTLVLPITVVPRENQPPVFTGAEVDFEPGQTKRLDLGRLTRYPYAEDRDELGFDLVGAKPDGFRVTLEGTRLRVEARPGTSVGTSASVTVGVRDATRRGKAGRIRLRVVPSTRPLALPQPDRASVRRGESTSLDVLANDAATNPFPDTPLRVVAVRGLHGDLPSGLSVTASRDKSTLEVRASRDATPGEATLQYEVADATGDPRRYAWGTVRLTVEDVPDPVSDLHVVGVGDRRVTLGWDAGAANGSPVDGYEVRVLDAASGRTVSTHTCSSTVCTVATPGNGRGHAMRVSVRARNGVGLSAGVETPSPFWSDVVPPAPVEASASPLDHGLELHWRQPAGASGSPVSSFAVSVGGVERTVQASGAGRYSVKVADPSLANGATVFYTIAARNDYDGGADHWNSASGSGVPAGAPLASGAPGAHASTDGSGDVSVSWSGIFRDNGRPLTGFRVVAYRGQDGPRCHDGEVEAPAGAVTKSVGAGATSWTLKVAAGDRWRFAVAATNSQGCVVSDSAQARPTAPPAAAPGITIAAPKQGREDAAGPFLAHADVTNPVPPPHGATGVDYQYRFVGSKEGGEPRTLDSDGTLTPDAALYGHTTSIEVRAVAVYPNDVRVPGEWSDEQDAGVPVSLEVGGLEHSTSSGGESFSWTDAPAGPGYERVEYRCGTGAPFAAMPAAGGCTADAGAALEVRITANDDTYTRMYAG